MLPIPFYEFLTQVMGYFYLFFQYICHALMLPLNAHLELSYFYNPFLEREFMYGLLFDGATFTAEIVKLVNDVVLSFFDELFRIYDFGITTSSPTWQCLLFLMGFAIVIFLIIKSVQSVFSK